MPARTGQRQVRHAIQVDVQHLVDVARDHVLDAEAFGELMQGELLIAEGRGEQPGRPVRQDELHGLRRVGLQVLFEERQLTIGQFV